MISSYQFRVASLPTSWAFWIHRICAIIDAVQFTGDNSTARFRSALQRYARWPIILAFLANFLMLNAVVFPRLAERITEAWGGVGPIDLETINCYLSAILSSL